MTFHDFCAILSSINKAGDEAYGCPLLIDKKMKKSALTELADVSSSTIAKLNRDEYVSLEVLERICRALRCDIGDVVELTEESEK